MENWKPEEITELRENIRNNGYDIHGELENIITAISKITYILSGTSYSISSSTEDILAQLRNMQDITSGGLSAQNDYLLKVLTDVESAEQNWAKGLQEALDALSGIWDNIDKSTWHTIE